MLRHFASMEMSDDEKYDHGLMVPDADTPDYPPNLQFSLSASDFAKICDDECAPGMTMRFAAMGTVTSIFRYRHSCRIEVELGMMSGADGEFADLEMPPSIALCDGELDRLELDDDCERGDLLHLIGTLRVESTHEPRFGDGMVSLQITEAAVEDESEEDEDG